MLVIVMLYTLITRYKKEASKLLQGEHRMIVLQRTKSIYLPRALIVAFSPVRPTGGGAEASFKSLLLPVDHVIHIISRFIIFLYIGINR